MPSYATYNSNGDMDPQTQQQQQQQQQSPGNSAMNTSGGSGDGSRYFSNESLEDRNSSSSSIEGNISVERRKDHEFIPTRMKTIAASKPAANPAQFTRVTSNPLLISAQKQMLQVEEVKKAKQELLKQRSASALMSGPSPSAAAVNDEPDWQSELSSWKTRRRKQSEETLMRVAEIKALEGGDGGAGDRKVSLNKKLSGLLHTDDGFDWSDLGLETEPAETSSSKSRSMSRSPHEPAIREEEGSNSPTKEPEYANENGLSTWEYTSGPGANSSNNNSSRLGNEQEEEQELERWTSSTSLSSKEPVRRKSSEMSSTMKSRLEAFERERAEAEAEAAGSRKSSTAPDVHDEKFKEKLKNFQKISSRSDLGASDGGDGGRASGPKKPPPPLSYSKLIEPQHYASSSSLKIESVPEDDDGEALDLSKDLDDALEESYRSVLEEQRAGSSGPPSASSSNNKALFDDQDFSPSRMTPPAEKPPPPPPATADKQQLEDIDTQEREIIASLEMEEREHKKYMETVHSMKAASISPKPVVPQPSGHTPSPPRSSVKASSPPHSVSSQHSSHSSHSSAAAAATPMLKEPQYTPVVKNHSQQQQSPKKANGQRSYNDHWVIQEAEQRRRAEMLQRQQQSHMTPSPSTSATPSPKHGNGAIYENTQPKFGGQWSQSNNKAAAAPPPQNSRSQQPQFNSYSENLYANLGGQQQQSGPPPPMHSTHYPQQQQPSHSSQHHQPQQQQQREPPSARIPGPQVPPRNGPGEAQDRMLSVSGKKKCSHCKEELGRGAAMIIESLRLFYHLKCFSCCVCHIQLGNGSAGTDVRVRNNKLHCQNCYSNDEGLKFSKV